MTSSTVGTSAYREAVRVVGLYGDPVVSWSIVLQARLRQAGDADRATSALADLTGAYGNLGPSPVCAVVRTQDLEAVRGDFANRVYGAREPLIRSAMSEDGRSVIVACHHGAADGLGLLAVLSAAVGQDLGSSARGVSNQRSDVSFARRSLSRLREAAFSPPQRLRSMSSHVPMDRVGDWLVERVVDPDQLSAVNSAVFLSAARQMVDSWISLRAGGARRSVVMAVGASRRDGTAPLTPDRRTAYLRLVDVPSRVSVDGARELLRNTLPEPTFPASTAWGIGPMITRSLASRLGSTLLLSNLGNISGSDPLESVSFFPATGGPGAVALGLATTSGRTMVTVRASRRAFTQADALQIADQVVTALGEPTTHQDQYGS